MIWPKKLITLSRKSSNRSLSEGTSKAPRIRQMMSGGNMPKKPFQVDITKTSTF